MKFIVQHKNKHLSTWEQIVWDRIISEAAPSNRWDFIQECAIRIIEAENEREISSWHGYTETNNFEISIFPNEMQIRVAKGLKGDDFMVIKFVV